MHESGLDTVSTRHDACYLFQVVHDDVFRTWQGHSAFPLFLPFPTVINFASIAFCKLVIELRTAPHIYGLPLDVLVTLRDRSVEDRGIVMS